MIFLSICFKDKNDEETSKVDMEPGRGFEPRNLLALDFQSSLIPLEYPGEILENNRLCKKRIIKVLP